MVDTYTEFTKQYQEMYRYHIPYTMMEVFDHISHPYYLKSLYPVVYSREALHSKSRNSKYLVYTLLIYVQLCRLIHNSRWVLRIVRLLSSKKVIDYRSCWQYHSQDYFWALEVICFCLERPRPSPIDRNTNEPPSVFSNCLTPGLLAHYFTSHTRARGSLLTGFRH